MQSAQLLLQAYTAHALLTPRIDFLASPLATSSTISKEQDTHSSARKRRNHTFNTYEKNIWEKNIYTSIDHATDKKYKYSVPTAAGIHRTRVAGTQSSFSHHLCHKQHNEQAAGNSLCRSKTQEEIIHSTHMNISTSIGHATEKSKCRVHTPHTRCWHTIEFPATINTKQHKEQAAETHVGAVNWVLEQGRNERDEVNASEKFQ